MEKESKFPDIKLHQLGGLDQSDEKASLSADAFSTLEGLYPREAGSLSRIPGKNLLFKFPYAVMGVFQMFSPYGYGAAFIQTNDNLKMGGWIVPDPGFDPTIIEPIDPRRTIWNFSENKCGASSVLWDQTAEGVTKWEKIALKWDQALQDYANGIMDALDPFIRAGDPRLTGWTDQYINNYYTLCGGDSPGSGIGILPGGGGGTNTGAGGTSNADGGDGFGPTDLRTCGLELVEEEISIYPFLIEGEQLEGGNSSNQVDAFASGPPPNSTPTPIPPLLAFAGPATPTAFPEFKLKKHLEGSSSYNWTHIDGGQALYNLDRSNYAKYDKAKIDYATFKTTHLDKLVEKVELRILDYHWRAATLNSSALVGWTKVPTDPDFPGHETVETRIDVTLAALAGLLVPYDVAAPVPSLVDIYRPGNDFSRTITHNSTVEAASFIVTYYKVVCKRQREYRALP